ncbi:MAG: 4-(cytidine 5'-diphospho)-2-C-methyl-D-erythritol kinase [Acidimicrobiales bacterium]
MSENDHEFARAKLTRDFRVLGRRDDGYHAIRSEMVTLELRDDLEFSAGDGLEIVDAIDWSGRRPGDVLSSIVPGANLVTRALELVGRKAHIRLTKRIPPGAGLGGGSADAAAVLRWAGIAGLDRAALLGADVPFCVRGGRALVQGIGDVLEPLPIVDASFVLVVPAIAVSTAAVYRAFDEFGSEKEPDASNDLEKAALVVEPRLAQYRDQLKAVTSRRPQLAGSGATWFVECGHSEAIRVAEELRASVADAGVSAVVVATKSAANSQ